MKINYDRYGHSDGPRHAPARPSASKQQFTTNTHSNAQNFNNFRFSSEDDLNFNPFQGSNTFQNEPRDNFFGFLNGSGIPRQQSKEGPKFRVFTSSNNPFVSRNSGPFNQFSDDGPFSGLGGIGSLFNAFFNASTGFGGEDPFCHPMAAGRPGRHQFHQRA